MTALAARLHLLGAEGGLLVLRHSVREAIATADVAAATAAPLTDEGRSLARNLGELLPAVPVRLFWSPVPRCRDTAELIAEGARASGRRAELVGPRDYLGALYVLDPDRVTRLFAELGQGAFLDGWLAGQHPREILQPPAEAGRQLLRALLDERGGFEGLDVHVTHDLTLITMLSLVCEVAAESFGWPGYLEGALLQARGAELCWRYGAREWRTGLTGEEPREGAAGEKSRGEER